MTERLRVGVVGVGIGQAHLLAYVLAPELFEVVAIAEPDDARRERAASDWNVTAVPSLEDLLGLDIDVVDLCTPPFVHEDQCIAALRTGRHVICEKPLVTDLDAMARLEEAAARASGHLMPIFQYRFAPGIARMKAVADEGLCGRLYLATSETAWSRGADYYATPSRGTFAGEGGGTVLLHGTHAHDLVSFVAGPLVRIHAQTATLVNDVETEDTAAAFGATADGGFVSMAVTLGARRETTRLRLCFENVDAESSLEPYEPGNEPWTFDWATPELADEANRIWAELPPAPSGFSGQLAAFHSAVTAGEPLPVTLADARRALELATAWYESSRTGRAVELPFRTN